MICLELFWTLFKIGAFTFGGGYAMLPLIQSEVESRGWLPLTQLVDFVAVSESTPGPFAVNCPERCAPRWGWCCLPSSSFCWWRGPMTGSKPARCSAG